MREREDEDERVLRGLSLQIFKALAPDAKNLVVIPGYCLPGTVGNLVQAKVKKIELDVDEVIHVRCEVETVVHSDHTDSRGILELISQVSPHQAQCDISYGEINIYIYNDE